MPRNFFTAVFTKAFKLQWVTISLVFPLSMNLFRHILDNLLLLQTPPTPSFSVEEQDLMASPVLMGCRSEECLKECTTSSYLSVFNWTGNRSLTMWFKYSLLPNMKDASNEERLLA
ncbi:hypothetical protein FEM48_Zijuj01G0191400 [Ziziphus jujuba var. spinosa]|uniref:Uncharacterized protein n=1 Tax=Ziziphus jujuba var. spinosa TaxID=714518 RepID=A0A978W316_ZIZJJ|nr:hypothetical protein FEM48_Zijuj01G0191400 [Ziziphus jujuba var. spinosa]